MAKDPSPLLGYNNNIRHKNRVFHVQTEDSGVRHPHIITHLFMDGGRILKSVKTSYAEHLGVDKMADLVRKMMKDQHKGMLIALRDGQFDAVIDGDAPKAKVPEAPASGPEVSASASASASAPAMAAVASAPAIAAAATSAPAIVAAAAPAPPASVPRTAPSADALPMPEARPPAPPISSATAVAKPGSADRIEIAEPERAAAHAAPLFEPAPTDLQPPPANLFRPRTGGNYSTTGGNYSTVLTPPPPPDSRPAPNSSRLGVRGATMRPAGLVGKPPTVPPNVQRSAPTGRPVTSPGRPPPVPSAGQRQSPPIRRASSPPPPLADQNRAARRPNTNPVVTAKAPEARYASARPAAIFGQAKPRSGSSIFGEDIISDKSLDEVIMSYLADESPKVDPKRRK
jgi:hypothetical protein